MSLNKEHEKAAKEFKMAEKAAELIQKADDREYFLGELNKGPWFGIQKET